MAFRYRAASRLILRGVGQSGPQPSLIPTQLSLTRGFSAPAISSAMVKMIRDATGAPMMECKKAIAAVLADESVQDKSDSAMLTACTEWLRKRGSALAANRAGKSAKEGVVVMAIDASKRRGTLVEVNCETDFVSRNAMFMSFATRVAVSALNHSADGGNLKTNEDSANASRVFNVEALRDLPLPAEKSDAAEQKLSTEIVDVVTNCRENVKVRRGVTVDVPQGKPGFVAGYVHNELPIPEDVKPLIAKLKQDGFTIGVGGAASVVSVTHNEGNVDEKLNEVADGLAMQAVAARPEYLSRERVPSAVLDKEREIIIATADLANKPEKVVEGIMKGKTDKFFEGIVFLEQQFLVTNDTKKPKVNQLLQQHPLKPTVTSFARLTRGEGEDAPEPTEK